ncbi:retrovirus-related pol polyprotein from transposon TNT 1-94, partial [Tanacetum coccineum]
TWKLCKAMIRLAGITTGNKIVTTVGLYTNSLLDSVNVAKAQDTILNAVKEVKEGKLDVGVGGCRAGDERGGPMSSVGVRWMYVLLRVDRLERKGRSRRVYSVYSSGSRLRLVEIRTLGGGVSRWIERTGWDVCIVSGDAGASVLEDTRLVAQGYNQQEGIDYDETYAPVARLESIRILLAYACAIDFKLFQMDVTSAFLNGFINEDVYMAQPPGFIDFKEPDHVYKLKKALYGLKQASKAWYDRLKAFFIKHEYKIGMVDKTLFTKKKSSNLIIVQIYVDDIIFGSTCQDICDEFAKIMHDEFEMSMMGELNFFLGLQIKQMEDGIFFNQSKYIKEMPKKFGLEDSKPMKTPMSSDTKLTKDEECELVDSTKNRGMIGSLLYLTTSLPDIMFSVCLCARFQEDPKTSHLEAVKRIFRYINGTTHLG